MLIKIFAYVKTYLYICTVQSIQYTMGIILLGVVLMSAVGLGIQVRQDAKKYN